MTASRRSERLMDVPMAVTAVTAQQLKDAGAVTTRDLSQLAPGLNTVTNGKLIQPAIRGVSSTSGGAGEEQNVAMYLDGVYMASATGNVFTLKNIERVEVLKGPQGTLFGRNATGGAIRIFTRDPGPERELNASASYGAKLKSQDFSLYAATPITDSLAVSFSGNLYDDKGYITNIVPGWDQGKQGQTHSYAARVKFAWRPLDNFKAVLIADQGSYQSDVPYSIAPVDNISSTRNTPGYLGPTGPYTITDTFKPTTNNRTSGISLQLDYDLPTYSLQSTTAYRTNSNHSMLDADRVNLRQGKTVSADSNIWFTQEGLFTSNFEGPANFIAGVYYFRADADAENTSYVNGPITTPGGGLIGNGTLNSQVFGYVKTQALSGFTDGSYAVSDQLKLFAGIRYTSETKKLSNTPVLPARPQLHDETTWRNVSYRVTAQYHFNDATNAYATYSTGFKSGTYNATNAARVDKAAPEKISAFEVGVKSRIGGLLDLTAAAFHYNYDNIQVTQTNTVNGVPNAILRNAGKAVMEGAELEIVTRPIQGFQLRAGAAWLPKAEYTEFANGLDSVPRGYPGSLDPSLCPGPSCGLGNDQIVRDLSGTPIIRAPEFTTNIGASYERDLAGGRLELTSNYFYTTKYYRVPGGHIAEDAYSLLNATAAWWAPGDKVRFSLWGRNLGDQLYYVNVSPNAQGIQASPAAPREIGVSIEYKF